MAEDTEKLFKSKWSTRPLLPSQMVQARMIELPLGFKTFIFFSCNI
jgi:hypothetical protein